MIIKNTYIDSRNDRWTIVGYSAPRIRSHGSTYRLIRQRDGARVRIMSNKFYWLDVAASYIDDLLNVPDGHNESVNRGKKIEADIKTASLHY